MCRNVNRGEYLFYEHVLKPFHSLYTLNVQEEIKTWKMKVWSILQNTLMKVRRVQILSCLVISQ